MIRLFTALPLPDDLRTRIAALEGGIGGARWVAAENLHITLRFVGEVQEDRIDDIVAAVEAVRAPAFEIAPGGTGHFGTRRRVDTVWVGIERSPEITALHARIDSALVRAGLPPERRKYAPHITVARLRGAREGKVLGWLEATGGFFAPPADGFRLYESSLGRGGPVYTPLAEFALS